MDARTAAKLACRLLALYLSVQLIASLPSMIAASFIPLSMVDTALDRTALFALALFGVGILTQVVIILLL